MRSVAETALGATLGRLVETVRRRLAESGIEAADLEARLLVEHFTGTMRIDAIIDPDRPVADRVIGSIDAALVRRCGGEPLHRILGFREFYGLPLLLSRETLEPRPDTEVLVDLVLPAIRACAAEKGTCRILDLGTGTGAIALAILSQVPQARATAVDLSEDALATATENARRLGLADRFLPVCSDWFEKISGRFDAILSNPPYITDEEMAGLPANVADFDPPLALKGGPDGLKAYRGIATASADFLESKGIVAVEIGHLQKTAVAGIFAQAGLHLKDARRDLGGNDRALLFGK